MDAQNGQDTGAFHPRISQNAFVALIFILLAIAIIFVACRSWLRFRLRTPVAVDDVLLWLAVVILAGATGVAYWAHSMIYFQMAVFMMVPGDPGPGGPPGGPGGPPPGGPGGPPPGGPGGPPPPGGPGGPPPPGGPGGPPPNGTGGPPLYGPQPVSEVKAKQAMTMLVWTTIYLVKISYLIFFRRLVFKITKIYHWWWFVTVIVCLAAGVSIPFTWYISGVNLTLTATAMARHLTIYTQVTSALDISTDVLILSIPLLIILNIRALLIQKLTAFGILSLSFFMIACAIVRTAFNDITSQMNQKYRDQAWTYFWLVMEADVAIIMVSLTAFRSLYGQARANSPKQTQQRASKQFNLNDKLQVDGVVLEFKSENI